MGEFVMFVTAAMIRKVLTELKKASEKMFQGEVTITKRDGWLIGTILVLTGIAVGLINAPLTHGINISIMSNNGNNGNNSGHNSSNNHGSYSDTGAVDGKAEDACGSLPKKETASKVKAAVEDKKAGACCKRRKKGMKRRQPVKDK